MSLFENLKEFVEAHFGININIKNSNMVNIQINNNNNPKPCEYNEENNSLSVNIKRLDPHTELQEFRKIVVEELFEDSILLEKQSQERVIDIESKDEDILQSLAYFRDKIPHDDFNILRQAAYIKKTFGEHRDPEVIFRLKGEVIKKYGRRGLNICNLYSSGHFDTIRSMYEEIARQNLEEKIFLENYNLLINEEAFAVFVSRNMSSSDVKDIIEKKIKRSKRYGLKSVTIHGIGKNNVKKIRDFISEFEDAHPDINKVIEEKGNIIFARLIWS